MQLNFRTPDGRIVRLKCKTGNTIAAVKRKLEFKTQIPDNAQILMFGTHEIEEENIMLDTRTLLDYSLNNDDTIVMKVDDSAEPKTALQTHLSQKRSSILDAYGIEEIVDEETETDSLSSGKGGRHGKRPSMGMVLASEIDKELRNPELTKEDRRKLRMHRNQSYGLALIDEDIDSGPQTLETYQSENLLLKQQLKNAYNQIELLKREIAQLKSSGAASTKATSAAFDAYKQKQKH